MKKSLLTKLFATLALGLTASAAWAVQPEAGKVYRVKNVEQTLYLAAAAPGAQPIASAKNTGSDAQLWLMETTATSNTLAFRSLLNGQYLRSNGNSAAAWSTTRNKENNNTHLKVTAQGDGYAVYGVAYNVSTAMHSDGQHMIVTWTAQGNKNSQWDFEEVDITAADVQAKLDAIANNGSEEANEDKYQAALDNLFADKACTTLKANIQSLSEANLEANADYKALNATLQNMVKKVKSGNWAETDPNSANNGNDEARELNWDSDHAKKYRVQLYEAYPEANNAANFNKVQAYTNMCNPTGVISDSQVTLYVMVEGAPTDDRASLFMSGVTGSGMFNNVTTGTELHEGLNVITGWADCAHQFVYYVANCIDNQGKPVKGRELSTYAPVKIHIEGGSINGFFNYRGDELYTPDTNEDLFYTLNRCRHEMYDLLGEGQILHLHAFNTPTKAGNTAKANGTKKVCELSPETDFVECMRQWDRMSLSERFTMGLQSDEDILSKRSLHLYETLTGDDVIDPGFQYSDYFNNPMMGITMQGDLFMNATWWRSAYNISCIPSLLTGFIDNQGNMWGPAHEYGHENQTPIKLVGTTEISNNLFPNIASYFQNTNTSRAEAPVEQLKVFNDGKNYIQHNIWSCTRMYYQLFVYYHVIGKNKKFYPRLYELLRRDPLVKSYKMSSAGDQLHFYKKACIAAQEDLTDYFESWGFFRVLEGLAISDYANNILTCTQEEIDAAKAYVAALNLPKNNQIILCDDRPGAVKYDPETGNLTDEPRESHANFKIEWCGPMGGIKDFINGVQAQGEFSYAVDGNTLTVTMAEGASAGVGFLIYDENGKLLSFSNDYTFPINSECAAAIVAGTAKMVAVSANGDTVEGHNTYSELSAADRLVQLQKLIATGENECKLVDATNTKVSYAKAYYAESLQNAIAQAKAATAETPTAEIDRLYLALVEEITAYKNNDLKEINIIDNSTYQLVNRKKTGKALAVKTNGDLTTATKRSNPTATTAGERQIWILERAGTTDAGNATYYLRNASTKKYIGTYVDKDSNDQDLDVKDRKYTMTNKSGAYTFEFHHDADGFHAVWWNGNDGNGLNIDGGDEAHIIKWGAWEENSEWSLTLIEADEKGLYSGELNALIKESEKLLAQSGSMVIEAENVELNADMFETNARNTNTNFGEQFTGFDVLCDGDIETYFHSDYSGANSSDGKDHWIGVDLGEGKALTGVQIMYNVRNAGGSLQTPEAIKIQASNVDGWSNKNADWKTLATITEGLPSNAGGTWVSNVINQDGDSYRYWRLQVNQAQQNSGGHAIFALAEFGIAGAEEVITPAAQYPNVTAELMIALRDELVNAKAKQGSTKAKMIAALEELYADYIALANAMEVSTPPVTLPETGIEAISADAAKSNGIFDLQGRRLNKVGQHGIYIIDGEKIRK